MALEFSDDELKRFANILTGCNESKKEKRGCVPLGFCYEKGKKGVVMDIIAVLRRAERDYALGHPHGSRPRRIVLVGEAAEAFADELAHRIDHLSSTGGFGMSTPDEKFLNGDVAYFKGIPVIAHLERDDVLVVGGSDAECQPGEEDAVHERTDELVGDCREVTAFLDSERVPGEQSWVSPWITKGSAIDILIEKHLGKERQ